MDGLASTQAGVLARSQLYAVGITRGEVRANVRAGRWQRIGSHCISMRTGPLAREAQLWSAVLEGGPRAFLDGDSALVAAGLRHYEPASIRVSVPRGARIRHRGTAANIRQTRRWDPDDLDQGAFPRTRTPVAAIRAALWARSDRQATLLLTMVVQQRLASSEQLAVELLRIRRDKRRGLVQGVLLDIVGECGLWESSTCFAGVAGEAFPSPTCRFFGVPRPAPTTWTSVGSDGISWSRSTGSSTLGRERRRRRLASELGRHGRGHRAPTPCPGAARLPRRLLRPDRRSPAQRWVSTG